MSDGLVAATKDRFGGRHSRRSRLTKHQAPITSHGIWRYNHIWNKTSIEVSLSLEQPKYENIGSILCDRSDCSRDSLGPKFNGYVKNLSRRTQKKADSRAVLCDAAMRNGAGFSQRLLGQSHRRDLRRCHHRCAAI